MNGYGFVNEKRVNGIIYQCWRSITDPTDEVIVAIEPPPAAPPKKDKSGKPPTTEPAKKVQKIKKARIKTEWGKWR